MIESSRLPCLLKCPFIFSSRCGLQVCGPEVWRGRSHPGSEMNRD